MGSMVARILALILLMAVLPAYAGDQEPADEWGWARRGLGIASVTLLGAGATFTALAFSELNSADDTVSGAERVAINGRIDDYNIAAVTCYTVAATALVVYLVWKLWPTDDPPVQPGPGGLQLSLRF
jgi:hypothetical protein